MLTVALLGLLSYVCYEPWPDMLLAFSFLATPLQEERLIGGGGAAFQDDNSSVSDFDEGSDTDEDLNEVETVCRLSGGLPSSNTAMSYRRALHKTKGDFCI